MQYQPLISIIIPTYNCEKYVDDCIQSVLKQLQDNYELIIVDDGSSDGTQSILQKYKKIKHNIKIIYIPHKGVSVAKNIGLDNAIGQYVTFVDCDDCLENNFLIKNKFLLTEKMADLYIFGIKFIPLNREHQLWTVQDKFYNDARSFADDYIRTKKLMIYSNSNKFYKNSIIQKLDLKFRDDIDFGEDRLFNYKYLTGCRHIITSKQIMLRYIQRSIRSLSSRYVKNYFRKILKLHVEKMRYFIGLSHKVSNNLQKDFLATDLFAEMKSAFKRFDNNPQEKDETMPLVNKIVMGTEYESDISVDIIIILGSKNCEYKVKKALTIGNKNPDIKYIVSGGNIHSSGFTEAKFMANYLNNNGVDISKIYIEDSAKNTEQNLIFSEQIINKINKDSAEIKNKTFTNLQKIGVVTNGFHMARTCFLVNKLKLFTDKKICYLLTYSLNTGLDIWYQNEIGQNLVLSELKKIAQLMDSSSLITDWTKFLLKKP